MDQKDKASRDLAIKARDLAKPFGSYLALNGIDLDIQRGECVTIFGPNGAGKTTLIKVLATIMNPSAGTVWIDGINLKDNIEEVRRRIGIVTHQTFLYNNLTTYENLDFYCRMFGVPNRKERLLEVIETVGMTSRLHDRVGTLSRGMQQRVSFARSQLHKPPIMLLDEPETGLDQDSISMLWKMLKGSTEDRRTIVLTTHNLEQGLEFADRILIMDQGKIVYEGLRQSLDLPGLKKAYKSSTGALP
ncbi:MAG: heme ABC exporter ATP-binding protein CcmA [Dehalococcoidia bacterium]|nr:heme ABC exporter ATP-binding protein CcmA [Dehalococcoidia bacterium]